jgi:copper(I)-binding protein
MGLHVMIMGLTKKLIEGETLTLTLTFEKAGSIEVPIPVAGPGAMMAPSMN